MIENSIGTLKLFEWNLKKILVFFNFHSSGILHKKGRQEDMYDRDDYGDPVEARVVGTVIEMTDRGYGFISAFYEGRRMKLFFHLNGERLVKNVDGVCEWRRLQDLRVKPILVGMEIVFDKLKGANQIDFWCPRETFDEVYSTRRRLESNRYGGLAFGYR